MQFCRHRSCDPAHIEQARGHGIRLHGAHVGGCGGGAAQVVLLMWVADDLVVLLLLSALHLSAATDGSQLTRVVSAAAWQLGLLTAGSRMC